MVNLTTNWTQLEQLIGTGFGPVFGNSIILGGLFLMLFMTIALALWGAPLSLGTIIMVGLILVIVFSSNLLPAALMYLALLIVFLLFLNFLLKTLNER